MEPEVRTDPPPPPDPPIPVLWQRIESRLTGKLEAGLAELAGKVAAQGAVMENPGALLSLILELEVSSLNLAREEMRRDGLIPTMHSGQRMWFDIAKAVSHYLRGRIGLPLDPGGGVAR